MLVENFEGSLLILVPHMDDCVLGCGGLIALLPDKTQLHICYVTDGARSPMPIFPWRDPAPTDLCAIRREEARAAMTYLGVPATNIHFLDLPDSNLKQHMTQLKTSLTRFISQVKPDYIFVPFRYDRHPDHLALNRVVIAGAWHAQVWEYFVYHHWRLLPTGDIRHYIKPDQLLVVDIEAASNRKRAALDYFKSQTTLFYSWQTRPNLTPQLLDDVSRDAEMFVKYDPLLTGTAIFKSRAWWIVVAHYLEPIIKRNKDRIVALVKRGLLHG